MGDLIDFERGRQRLAHQRREAKAGKLREAFQAVREAWEGEGSDRAAKRRKWKDKLKSADKKTGNKTGNKTGSKKASGSDSGRGVNNGKNNNKKDGKPAE